MSTSGFLMLDSPSGASSVLAQSDEEAEDGQSSYVVLHSPSKVLPSVASAAAAATASAAAQSRGRSPLGLRDTPIASPSADLPYAPPQLALHDPHPHLSGSVAHEDLDTPYDPLPSSLSTSFDQDAARADTILHSDADWPAPDCSPAPGAADLTVSTAPDFSLSTAASTHASASAIAAAAPSGLMHSVSPTAPAPELPSRPAPVRWSRNGSAAAPMSNSVTASTLSNSGAAAGAVVLPATVARNNATSAVTPANLLSASALVCSLGGPAPSSPFTTTALVPAELHAGACMGQVQVLTGDATAASAAVSPSQASCPIPAAETSPASASQDLSASGGLAPSLAGADAAPAGAPEDARLAVPDPGQASNPELSAGDAAAGLVAKLDTGVGGSGDLGERMGDEDDDEDGSALGLLGCLDEVALRSIPPALLALLQQLEEERDHLAGRLLESDAELSSLRASYNQLSQSHASSQTWLNQLLTQQLEIHEHRRQQRQRRRQRDAQGPTSGMQPPLPQQQQQDREGSGVGNEDVGVELEFEPSEGGETDATAEVAAHCDVELEGTREEVEAEGAQETAEAEEAAAGGRSGVELEEAQIETGVTPVTGADGEPVAVLAPMEESGSELVLDEAQLATASACKQQERGEPMLAAGVPEVAAPNAGDTGAAEAAAGACNAGPASGEEVEADTEQVDRVGASVSSVVEGDLRTAPAEAAEVVQDGKHQGELQGESQRRERPAGCRAERPTQGTAETTAPATPAAAPWWRERLGRVPVLLAILGLLVAILAAGLGGGGLSLSCGGPGREPPARPAGLAPAAPLQDSVPAAALPFAQQAGSDPPTSPSPSQPPAPPRNDAPPPHSQGPHSHPIRKDRQHETTPEGAQQRHDLQPACSALHLLGEALCCRTSTSQGADHSAAVASGETAAGAAEGRRGRRGAAAAAAALAENLCPAHRGLQPCGLAVRVVMGELLSRWHRLVASVKWAEKEGGKGRGDGAEGRGQERRRRRRTDGDGTEVQEVSAAQVVSSWAASVWLPAVQPLVASVAADDELPESILAAHKVVALASRLCTETGYDLGNLSAPVRQRLDTALADMAAVAAAHVNASYSGGAADVAARLGATGQCLGVLADWAEADADGAAAREACRRRCGPRAHLVAMLRSMGLPPSLVAHVFPEDSQQGGQKFHDLTEEGPASGAAAAAGGIFDHFSSLLDSDLDLGLDLDLSELADALDPGAWIRDSARHLSEWMQSAVSSPSRVLLDRVKNDWLGAYGGDNRASAGDPGFAAAKAALRAAGKQASAMAHATAAAAAEALANAASAASSTVETATSALRKQREQLMASKAAADVSGPPGVRLFREALLATLGDTVADWTQQQLPGCEACAPAGVSAAAPPGASGARASEAASSRAAMARVNGSAVGPGCSLGYEALLRLAREELGKEEGNGSDDYDPMVSGGSVRTDGGRRRRGDDERDGGRNQQRGAPRSGQDDGNQNGGGVSGGAGWSATGLRPSALRALAVSVRRLRAEMQELELAASRVRARCQAPAEALAVFRQHVPQGLQGVSREG